MSADVEFEFISLPSQNLAAELTGQFGRYSRTQKLVLPAATVRSKTHLLLP